MRVKGFVEEGRRDAGTVTRLKPALNIANSSLQEKVRQGLEGQGEARGRWLK